MKNRLSLISILFLAFIISSCEKENLTLGLGEEVTIPFSKTATLFDNGQEIRFKFADLVEESRCIPPRICIWAGRAIIDLEINWDENFELGNGDLTSLTDQPIPKSATYMDYTIELLAVSFDKDSHYGDESKYSITIKVDRDWSAFGESDPFLHW